MADEIWMGRLRSGDAVVVQSRGAQVLTTVIRRDKVKIVIAAPYMNCGEDHFSAKSGRSLRQSGDWFTDHLAEATPALVAKIADDTRRDVAHKRISRARIAKLSTEALEAAADLLDPPAPTETTER